MWFPSDANTSKSSGGFIPQTTKKLTTKKRCLIPCTVHELVSANLSGDAILNKNKLELDLVSIVGIIRSVEDRDAFRQFIISDGSGSAIAVKQFNDQKNNDEFVINKYVKVIGQVKRYSETNFLISVKIIPLKSFNEVTWHIVSVIHSHKILLTTLNEMDVDKSMSSLPLDDLSDKIVKVFKMNKSSGTQGISVDFIKSALPNFKPEEIQQKLHFMESEGSIYSTFNEDHFVLNQ